MEHRTVRLHLEFAAAHIWRRGAYFAVGRTDRMAYQRMYLPRSKNLCLDVVASSGVSGIHHCIYVYGRP